MRLQDPEEKAKLFKHIQIQNEQTFGRDEYGLAA